MSMTTGCNGAGLRLSLIGGWTLQADGQAVAVPHSVERLLAFVALRDGSPRSVVAGALWPDCPEPRAQGNLRSAMWRANRIVPTSLLEQTGRLSLDPAVEVDVHSLSLDVLASRDISSVSYSRATTFGELLPGWYDEWVQAERELVRQRWLHHLEELSRRLAEAGRFAEALEAALAAVRAEPLRESAHRVLIEIHLAEGNFGEARRSYGELRMLLARELGLEPSSLFASVHSRIFV